MTLGHATLMDKHTHFPKGIMRKSAEAHNQVRSTTSGVFGCSQTSESNTNN